MSGSIRSVNTINIEPLFRNQSLPGRFSESCRAPELASISTVQWGYSRTLWHIGANGLRIGVTVRSPGAPASVPRVSVLPSGRLNY